MLVKQHQKDLASTIYLGSGCESLLGSLTTTNFKLIRGTSIKDLDALLYDDVPHSTNSLQKIVFERTFGLNNTLDRFNSQGLLELGTRIGDFHNLLISPINNSLFLFLIPILPSYYFLSNKKELKKCLK